jgi:hypothetical protein
MSWSPLVYSINKWLTLFCFKFKLIRVSNNFESGPQYFTQVYELNKIKVNQTYKSKEKSEPH